MDVYIMSCIKYLIIILIHASVLSAVFSAKSDRMHEFFNFYAQNNVSKKYELSENCYN